MKLIKRFGVFIQKHQAETTGILATLVIILLLFEFFFEISDTKIMVLMPSLAAIISALLLFLAFRQSVMGNRYNRETVTHKYYLEIIQKANNIGNTRVILDNIETVKEIQPMSTYVFTLFNGGEICTKIVKTNPPLPDTLPSKDFLAVYEYLWDYIRFYDSLKYVLMQYKTENLMPEHDTDLQRRFKALFSNFLRTGETLIEFTSPEIPTPVPQQYIYFNIHVFLKTVKTLYNEINPQLN